MVGAARTDVFVGAMFPPKENDAGVVEATGAAIPLNENADAVVFGATEEQPNANEPTVAFCC